MTVVGHFRESHRQPRAFCGAEIRTPVPPYDRPCKRCTAIANRRYPNGWCAVSPPVITLSNISGTVAAS